MAKYLDGRPTNPAWSGGKVHARTNCQHEDKSERSNNARKGTFARAWESLCTLRAWRKVMPRKAKANSRERQWWRRTTITAARSRSAKTGPEQRNDPRNQRTGGVARKGPEECPGKESKNPGVSQAKGRGVEGASSPSMQKGVKQMAIARGVGAAERRETRGAGPTWLALRKRERREDRATRHKKPKATRRQSNKEKEEEHRGAPE